VNPRLEISKRITRLTLKPVNRYGNNNQKNTMTQSNGGIHGTKMLGRKNLGYLDYRRKLFNEDGDFRYVRCPSNVNKTDLEKIKSVKNSIESYCFHSMYIPNEFFNDLELLAAGKSK
jgi:hypothetical protein